MSITLQSATGVNVIFDLVKNTGEGQVYQNLGTSFADTKVVSAGLRIGKTKTARARTTLKYTYTYVDQGGITKNGEAYFDVGGTVPETMPLAEVDKAVFMIGTLAAHALFKDLMSRRRYSQS